MDNAEKKVVVKNTVNKNQETKTYTPIGTRWSSKKGNRL